MAFSKALAIGALLAFSSGCAAERQQADPKSYPVRATMDDCHASFSKVMSFVDEHNRLMSFSSIKNVNGEIEKTVQEVMDEYYARFWQAFLEANTICTDPQIATAIMKKALLVLEERVQSIINSPRVKKNDVKKPDLQQKPGCPNNSGGLCA